MSGVVKIVAFADSPGVNTPTMANCKLPITEHECGVGMLCAQLIVKSWCKSAPIHHWIYARNKSEQTPFHPTPHRRERKLFPRYFVLLPSWVDST